MKSVTYFFSLEIQTPVHVGCGEVYEPTGFVVNRKDKVLVAFEPEELLADLSSDELDRFTAICRKGTVQSLHEIYKFMNSKSESAQGRKVAVSDGFIDNHRQTLETAPNRIGNELNKFEISRTVFRSIDNQPYIPGSAIKGAIRTGVLNMRYKQRPVPTARRSSELEQNLLGGTFDRDPFRLVKVSDFVAVGEARRRIVYAVNKKKQPTDQASRGIPQILEVIEPGAKFCGTITMIEPDKRAEISRSLTIEELQQALAGFYGGEKQREERELRNINIPYPEFAGKAGEGVPLRIGRHCGAESLTIEGKRDIRIMLGRGKNKQEDHATTVWLAASSRNSTTGMQPFGWSSLTRLSASETDGVRKEVQAEYSRWLNGHQHQLLVYRERVAAATRERAEVERRVKLEADKKRLEELEKERYPWRELYPLLDSQSDWGGLKINVLESVDFLKFQDIDELAQRVGEKAKIIASGNKKKWEEDRETLVREWLLSAGLDWSSGVFVKKTKEPNLSKNQQELMDRISSCADWGQYQKNPIPVAQLDRLTGHALKKKFEDWGCNDRNAKKPKQQAWKELLAHLRSLPLK